MNLIFKIIVLFAFIIALFSPTLVKAQTSQEVEPQIKALVTQIIKEEAINLNDQAQLIQTLEIEFLTGDKKGERIEIIHGGLSLLNTPKLKTGDQIIITKTITPEGGESYLMTDFIRLNSLYILFAAFVILTILIARKRGLFSLVGMAISFLVIFKFILPQLSAGANPIIVAISASLVIIPVTFYMSHGFSHKTTTAVVGTLISLLITGLLASFFIDFSNLSGYSSEEAGFLQALKMGEINIKGLLLAGIIIGVLGVLDDITISQAAIVYQLKNASPKMKFRELYSRAMDVGRDHIASLVNTLILVYTGAALPLLLLFVDSSQPYYDLINYEIIAEEIVRTLIASMGLIIAVPLTTALTALYLSSEYSQTKSQESSYLRNKPSTP